VRSLKGEQWRCLSELKWRETDIIVRGTVYKFYSRDIMHVATDALTSAIKVCLLGKRELNDAGEVKRTNSDIYLEEQEDVQRLHAGKEDNGRKMPPFTFAVQLFSDAALVSWNGSKLSSFSFLLLLTCLPAICLGVMDLLSRAVHVPSCSRRHHSWFLTCPCCIHGCRTSLLDHPKLTLSTPFECGSRTS